MQIFSRQRIASKSCCLAEDGPLPDGVRLGVGHAVHSVLASRGEEAGGGGGGLPVMFFRRRIFNICYLRKGIQSLSHNLPGSVYPLEDTDAYLRHASQILDKTRMAPKSTFFPEVRR